MKHIHELAKSLYESRSEIHSVASLQDHLIDVRKAILKGRFYIGVRSVAKSGASRVLTMAFVDKHGELQEVWPAVYNLAGCDKNKRIKGGGMDMCFAAHYNLFHTLCPNMRYQDKMPRYKYLP